VNHVVGVKDNLAVIDTNAIQNLESLFGLHALWLDAEWIKHMNL
jgi:hypothetical protein